MRVQLRRSGGFANQTPLMWSLDSDTLSPEQAQTLRTLVEQAQFFSLPPELRVKGAGDPFQYDLTVEDGSRRHSVVADDGAGEPRPDDPDAMPPLQVLIQWITATGPGAPVPAP